MIREDCDIKYKVVWEKNTWLIVNVFAPTSSEWYVEAVSHWLEVCWQYIKGRSLIGFIMVPYPSALIMLCVDM